jgi:hypothetical protein
VNVSLSLASKKEACVIWIVFDAETMTLGLYLWFGGGAGELLPPLGDRVARHTEADKCGLKAERPNLRVVRRRSFNPAGMRGTSSHRRPEKVAAPNAVLREEGERLGWRLAQHTISDAASGQRRPITQAKLAHRHLYCKIATIHL